MPNILSGLLLAIAGFLTGLFLAKDSLKFQVVQMVIAVVLLIVFVFIVVNYKSIKDWFLQKMNDRKK